MMIHWARKNLNKVLVIPVVTVLSVLAITFPSVAVASSVLGYTQQVSIGPDGTQVAVGSSAKLSSDGRYVTFVSSDGALYVRDLQINTTQQVNVGPDGTQVAVVNGFAMSADGHHVAFNGQLYNGGSHLFVRDLQTNTTQLANFGPDGTQLPEGTFPALSADGRYVAFDSYGGGNYSNVYVRDLLAGTTQAASIYPNGTQINGYSQVPSISADGRYVAFDGNGTIYIRDIQDGSTVATSTARSTRPSISADGRYVSYESYGSAGYPQAFVVDLQTNTTQQVNFGPDGSLLPGGYQASISADGHHVVFVVPNNLQAYVRDLEVGTTEQVNFAPDSTLLPEGWLPVLSADGRYVAFASRTSSEATTLSAFVRDRQGASIQVLTSTIATMNLQQGITNSLDAKYQDALAAAQAATDGDYAGVISELNAALNQIAAQSGKKLTVSQADALIALTNQLISYYSQL
jgi:Tol biopolymer transport system component